MLLLSACASVFYTQSMIFAWAQQLAIMPVLSTWTPSICTRTHCSLSERSDHCSIFAAWRVDVCQTWVVGSCNVNWRSST